MPNDFLQWHLPCSEGQECHRRRPWTWNSDSGIPKFWISQYHGFFFFCGAHQTIRIWFLNAAKSKPQSAGEHGSTDMENYPFNIPTDFIDKRFVRNRRLCYTGQHGRPGCIEAIYPAVKTILTLYILELASGISTGRPKYCIPELFQVRW
jgi:hypothetical protein